MTLMKVRAEQSRPTDQANAGLEDLKRSEGEHRCSLCGVAFNPKSTGQLCPACLVRGAVEWCDATEPRIGGSPEDVAATRPRRAEATFGEFELMEELGRGGAGIVYRARQRGPGRVVALKLLQPGHMLSASEVERFQREAQTVARLEHPHILPLYSAGQHQGQPWLAVKYMSGGSLAEVIARSKSSALDSRSIASLVRKLALAVQHAHQRGVLHRDLKPGNVLLDDVGEPCISDFGLARVVDQDSALTRTGAFFGSPAYASPEQAARDNRDITVAADVYGLGAILFELLTGKAPFAGKHALDTLRQVVETPAPSPRALNPAVSRDLETICLKCLEKEPSRRYQTAQALADELERFLNSEPILAHPISRTKRAWHWCKRKPALATSLLLLLLLLFTFGIGGPITAMRFNEARRTAVTKELEARRTQYASDMRLAHQAEIDGDLATTRRLLKRHAPLARGEPDLRGWDWRYLWRQSQGSPHTLLGKHNTNSPYTVGLLPGGQGAFSSGLDGVVKLYDLPSRKQTGELRHDDPVTATAVSPDGRWLVSLTHTPNHMPGKKPVVIWDLPARREAAALFPHLWAREGPVAISPDSKVFAFVDQRDPEHLRICELPTGQEIARFPAQTDRTYPQGIVFTPDGHTLVFSEDLEGTLVLVDTSRWREAGRLKGHRRNVNALAVSPDGHWLASVSMDRSLRLWDLPARLEVAAREGLTAASYSVAFSPDSARLAATTGPSISIFSVPALERFAGLSTPSGNAECVAFVSDQELLAGATDGSVALFPLDAKTDARDFVQFTHGMAEFCGGCGAAICLSPDNTALLGVFTNGTFTVWQLPGLQSTGEVPLPIKSFYCAAIAAHGETAAFADGAGNVVLWRAADGQVTPFAQVEKVGLSRIAFSSDGRRLAFGGFGKYFVWDVPSRTQTHSFPGADTWACMSMAFSPDDQALAVGLFGGVTHYWPLNPSGNSHTLQGRQERVTDLGFINHPRTLITAGIDVRFWDVNTGDQSRLLSDLPGDVCRVAISPDETRMAVGFLEGGISILDFATGEELLRLKAFDWDVRRLAFSADGNSLIAASREEIRVWHAAASSETDRQDRIATIKP